MPLRFLLPSTAGIFIAFGSCDRKLRHAGPGGLPRGMISPFRDRAKVLIVDDGINRGETLTHLINLCRIADVEMLGAIVLDSRLNTESTARIEALMGNRPLYALYTWHSVAI
jgi:hypothetical protein